MKKQKIKRTFAGILAIVLVCVMAITSYSPLTAYAEDGHYDITAPVIDDVDVTGVRDTYTKNDTLEFKVHAYDEGGSGLTSIDLEFRVEKNDSYVDRETIYCSLSGEGMMYNRGTISYDEKTGYYTLGIPMSYLKPGYKYILNSIKAVDGVGNKTYADSSLIEDKISFVIERKNNATVLVNSVSILDANNESVIGKTTTNERLQFYVALNNTENVERVNLEFRARGLEYDNKVVTCYLDGGKYTGHDTITRYSSFDDIREYELVTVSIEDADGNEEIIALPNEEVVVSVQETETTSPSEPEKECNVESVKYYKEDGTEIKSTDVLTHGEKIKFQLKTSGIDQKIHVGGAGVQGNISLEAQTDKVDGRESIDLFQDENDFNLFEGILEIGSKMYPTVWKVTDVTIYGEYFSCIYSNNFKSRPENILIQSKKGDIVLPNLNSITVSYSYLKKNQDGNFVRHVESKSPQNVPYSTKVSDLDLDLPTEVECPITGGKFLGWHVIEGNYDGETGTYEILDKGPIEDCVLTENRTVSLQPVFDKDYHVVNGKYYQNGNETEFLEVIEGKWDEKKSITQISNLYKDKFDKEYGFKGYKYTYREYDGTYNVSPITDNININIVYKYVDENGDLKRVKKSQFLPVAEVNDEKIQTIVDSFGCPKDSIKKADFEDWDYYFHGDQNSVNTNIYVSAEAEYKDKYVVKFTTQYLLDEYVKCDLVDKSTTIAELKKLAEKYRPSETELNQLDIKDWDVYIRPPVVYNFIQVESTANINNIVVSFEVIKQNRYEEDPKEMYEAREAKIYNVGDTITLPDKVANCKILKWTEAYYRGENSAESLELSEKMVLDKPGFYTIRCDQEDYVIEEPSIPTPDPDVKPDQPTPDTKPEQKPDRPAPDVKPEHPTPDSNLNDAVVTDKVTEIKNTIEQSKNNTESKETPKVEIKMGTATVVPAKVLEAAKGSDVDIVLQMDGYSWTINGKDIKGVNLKDINLEVKTNTSAIPIGLISKLAGDQPAMQLSLTHNGDFGFKANLNVNVGKENAGQFGNLYYYDSDGRLVFMNAGKIAEDGSVNLSFSHASDYVIVIGKDMTAKENGSYMTSKTDDKTTNKSNDKKAVKTGDQSNIVMISVILLLSVACITALGLIKKKRK